MSLSDPLARWALKKIRLDGRPFSFESHEYLRAIYDDASEFELEQFVHELKPDLVGSGIKEKYVFQKMGVPFRQMHSWDYSGPYHGYQGFSVFARDVDLAVNSPTWKLVKAPF